MPLTSLDDLELRSKAKRANQRLRDLEKFELESGVGPSPAQQLAAFYLEDFGGRERFPERLGSLSEETKDMLQAALSNFLMEDTSTVRGYKQSLELYGEVELAREDYIEGTEGGGINPFSEEKEKEDYNTFYKLFDRARNQGLTKIFDYKTLKNALSWSIRQANGDKSIIDKIASDIDKLAEMGRTSREQLTRRTLINTLTRSRKSSSSFRKPGKVNPEQELKAEINDAAPKPKHMRGGKYRSKK